MRRRTPPVELLQPKLRTYDPARWIQDGIDHDDPFLAPLVRGMTATELFQSWYAQRVVAPARYRQALTAAVGQAAGDRWFYGR